MKPCCKKLGSQRWRQRQRQHVHSCSAQAPSNIPIPSVSLRSSHAYLENYTNSKLFIEIEHASLNQKFVKSALREKRGLWGLHPLFIHPLFSVGSHTVCSTVSMRCLIPHAIEECAEILQVLAHAVETVATEGTITGIILRVSTSVAVSRAHVKVFRV